MKHEISKEIIQMTRKALDSVGEESFEENGPDEVMDLSEISEKYKKLSLLEKIKVSQDLKEYTKCSETLIHILMRIENELLEKGLGFDLKEISAITKAGHPNLAETFDIE